MCQCVNHLFYSKMVDRLGNMKRSARGNGQGTCILCNESFGLFSLQAHQCQGCKKVSGHSQFLSFIHITCLLAAQLVCNKCGVDTHNPKGETIWYCKICSETREVLKLSLGVEVILFCTRLTDREKVGLMVPYGLEPNIQHQSERHR